MPCASQALCKSFLIASELHFFGLVPILLLAACFSEVVENLSRMSQDSSNILFMQFTKVYVFFDCFIRFRCHESKNVLPAHLHRLSI
jgi:hypothetical protein